MKRCIGGKGKKFIIEQPHHGWNVHVKSRQGLVNGGGSLEGWKSATQV